MKADSRVNKWEYENNTVSGITCLNSKQKSSELYTEILNSAKNEEWQTYRYLGWKKNQDPPYWKSKILENEVECLARAKFEEEIREAVWEEREKEKGEDIYSGMKRQWGEVDQSPAIDDCDLPLMSTVGFECVIILKSKKKRQEHSICVVQLRKSWPFVLFSNLKFLNRTRPSYTHALSVGQFILF